MGLLAASLDCPEQYRPWCGAGLDLLFLPGGLPAARAAAAASTAGPQASATTPANPSPEAATRPAPAPVTPESAANPVADAAASPAAPAWPAPWSALAARVATPPKVIITYASLAQDLAGAADPGRRKLFQRILAYLAWPAGTTLFWPLSFAPGVDAQGLFATDIFAQGVQHFRIAHVLCFGADVAQRCATLFPAELKDGPKVHPLPDPQALAPLLPHELQLALVHLKDISL